MSFTIEDNILKGVVKPLDIDYKLGQVTWDALTRNPDHVAQIDVDTGEKTTCGQMKDRSVRCAVWMKKLSIRPDDIVVAVTHNHVDSYLPVFATFLVDATFNSWNQNITLYSARKYMKKFAPKLIFACEKAVDVLIEAARLESANVQIVVFGKHSSVRSVNEILNSQTKEEIDNFVIVNEKTPGDVAMIMLSSGTTGSPKGVMLSHRSIVALNMGNKSNQGSINLWSSTLDWVSCVCLIFQTLSVNGTRLISNCMDTERVLQITERYKVNLIFISPILVNQLAKCDSVEKKYDLRSLRTFLVGGCKYPKQILDSLQQKLSPAFVHNVYGTTESGGSIVSKTPALSKHTDSVGFVAPNCQIKFVDLTSGQALGPNQKGEIHFKTPNITLGYYKDPEATKRAFDDDGWYLTGDIGYYNEAGEIFIVDRLKETIKYRNNQIAPSEIEEVLMSHAEVQVAAVVGIPNELDGDWPVAFVKKVPSSQLSQDELHKLTSILEDYKKLRGGIYFVDDLPQTGSGKIAKNELKQMAQKLIVNKSS